MTLDLLNQRIAVDRELGRRGEFFDFFRMAWPQVEPSPLVVNWHLEEKCTHLEAVSKGEIRRLLINEPPGMGKSIITNILWNAWEWIQRPQTKFIYASFDASLVGTRDGGKVIRLLESDWFKLRWGNLLGPGKQAASKFDTLAGGFRFATSPKGKGTGRHANIRVRDDLLKPTDAAGGATQTKNALRFVADWEANTMSSRATDQTTVRDVLIMQRLHEEDPAGLWLLKGGIVHLNFPMMFEPSRACRTTWKALDGTIRTGGDRRTKEGELLFPARFPLWKVIEMRDTDMGEDVFAAQCQQRPARKGGGVFQRNWWQFWHYKPDVPVPCLCDECLVLKYTQPEHVQPTHCRVLPQGGFQVQSWDCTFKKVDTSDFVSGLVFQIYDRGVFLIERQNERLSFTNTVQAIRLMSQKYPRALDKLIEDKANGTAVEDVLKSEIPGITLVNPEGGKEARANAGSIYMSGGRFWLPHPEIMPGVWAYMAQHEGFPKASFDDDVDSTSQVLVRLRKFGEHFAAAMRKLRGET